MVTITNDIFKIDDDSDYSESDYEEEASHHTMDRAALNEYRDSELKRVRAELIERKKLLVHAHWYYSKLTAAGTLDIYTRWGGSTRRILFWIAL